MDLNTFSGQAGDVVTLTFVETSDWGVTAGTTDARCTVFSPTGDELDIFDSSALLDVSLVDRETYVLRVNANNLVSTGSYNLGLECR